MYILLRYKVDIKLLNNINTKNSSNK